MTGKIQKYADASMYDLTRVIDAADRLYASTAEFPEDPACWAEWMEALDMALESCPGTAAHYHKKLHPQDEFWVQEAYKEYRAAGGQWDFQQWQQHQTKG